MNCHQFRQTTVALTTLLFASLPPSPGALAQRDAARPQPQDIGALPGHLPKAHFAPRGMSGSAAYPIWIDASLLLNGDGSVNTGLVPPDAVPDVKAILARASTGGCVQIGAFFEDLVNPPERNSIEQAVRSSRLVILGKVTERSFGMSGPIPGQLLRVVPEEVFKGQSRSVPAYFVFMPVGTFQIGSATVCKTDSRYAAPPAVGDHVLLFGPEEPSCRDCRDEPYLEVGDDGGIITFHDDQAPSLPQRYRGAPGPKPRPASPEELVARVRAAAKGNR